MRSPLVCCPFCQIPPIWLAIWYIHHYRVIPAQSFQLWITVLTHLLLDKMATILANDIFKCIFLNENIKFFIQISLKFVPQDPIDNKPALVQVMAWRRTGDTPITWTDAWWLHWRIYAALGGHWIVTGFGNDTLWVLLRVFFNSGFF